MLHVLITVINFLFSVSSPQASLGAMVVGGGGSNLLDLSTLPETIVKRLSAVEALQVRFIRNVTILQASRVPEFQTACKTTVLRVTLLGAPCVPLLPACLCL